VDTIRGDYTRYRQRTPVRRPSRRLPGNHPHRHHQAQGLACPPAPPSCSFMLIHSKTRCGTLNTCPALSSWRRVSRYACDGGQHSQRPRGGEGGRRWRLEADRLERAIAADVTTDRRAKIGQPQQLLLRASSAETSPRARRMVLLKVVGL
jgi:hypothetical protein